MSSRVWRRWFVRIPRNAQGAAENQSRRLAKLLRGHHIPPSVRPERIKHDQLVVWCARTNPRIPIKQFPLSGSWTIGVDWRFRNNRDEQGAQLFSSSASLSVEHPDLCPARSSIVRFDFDRDRASAQVHLNVWQPEPLKDNVHWALPGRPDTPWDDAAVLAYLLDGALVEELTAAGWPRRQDPR